MASLARGNPARWWKSRSCGGPSRAPRALHIGPIRRWAGITVLTLLVLLLVGFWYATSPARISRLSEALFSRVLGGKVKVRTGHLSLSGTLLLSDIELSAGDNGPGGDVPLFSASNVEVRFDWFSLFSGQLTATQLVADTPVFNMIEDPASGHWNYERLHPSGLGGSIPGSRGSTHPLTLPVVVLHEARVRWGEIHDGRVENTTETRIVGDLTPDAVKPSLYRFQFMQMASDGKEDIGAMLHGSLDTVANTFTASAENVDMSDTLKSGMPRIAREWCDEHHLDGRISKLAINFNEKDGLTASVTFQNVGMTFMVEPEQGIGLGEDRPATPAKVRNVTGKVDFVLKGPAIHISNLTGKVLDYAFVADCDMDGTTFDSPFKLKLRFPDADLGDHYPPLFMAFLTSQDLLARVAPHGKMDISLDLWRTVAHGPLQFSGMIDCHDSMMRFAGFPYPMDHMNGQITFDRDSCTFHDVTAKADMNDVTITGTTGTNWAHRAIDFTVSSKNTYFDDRLADALPEKYRDIWNLFSIKAHGGFVCRVTRTNDVLDLPKVVVDVHVDDGSGFVRDWPFKFSQASGDLHFQSDETRISHFTAVTGMDGSGRISLDGVVSHPSGDVTNLKPNLHVKADVPIDADFLHGLPESVTDKLKDVTATGRIVFDGTLRRAATETHGVDIAGNLDWVNGTLHTPLAGGIVADAVTAHAALTPEQVMVSSLAGTLDLAPAGAATKSPLNLNLAGAFQIQALTGEFRVDAVAKDMAIPEKAPAFLPRDWADQWRAYAPGGAIDLDAHAAFRIGGPPATATQPALKVADGFSIDSYSAAITAHDVSLANAGWPDPIGKLNGDIRLTPDSITMTGMSATMGNVTGKWTGDYKPGSGAISVSGDAAADGWPTKWLSLLPDPIRKNLDLKREGVSLALHLDSLTRPGTSKPWAFEGQLNAGNFAITGPIAADAQKIAFTGRGTFDPSATEASQTDPYSFTGTVNAANLTLHSHRLDTLDCGVVASALSHEITISEINGHVAGGVLHGDIQVHTAYDPATSRPAATPAPTTQLVDWTSGGYEAQLVLNDADLAALMLPPDAKDEERKKVGTGHVFASLSLTETFGPHADRTGRGDLSVRDANIYNVPLSMGLMQVATLRLPVARSFQEATMSYYLRDNEITFERILLESRGINIAGLGTVTIPDNRMDLSFVTQTPHEVVIPLITDAISGLRNELLQISVTGTLDNPKVTPVPLSGIATTLKTLLPVQRADAGH